MPESNDCPDTEIIAKYARTIIPASQAKMLDDHFENCEACLNRFTELGKTVRLVDVPNCHIVNEIGRGRFGVVYKAWWFGTRRQVVALKVLNSSGEMEKSRFEREIEVLKKLDSPGIVKCLDAGVVGEMPYYVMEYVEGVHLDEYFNTTDKSLDEKLRVFQLACEAVAQAHEAGVIHRDLKPRNILVDAQGYPHIVDFGICAYDPTDQSTWDQMTITQTGDVIGTLKYMSPEQAWGGSSGPITERSDIWSLGIILYEIVTEGEHPYSLRSTPEKPASEALLDRIRKELPKIPRLDNLPRGHDLVLLLSRCLAWEPDRRIASAKLLADDIEAYRQGRKLRTKPFSIPYRIRRLAVGAAVHSRPMCWTAFIAATMLLIWGTVLFWDVGWTVPGHQLGDSARPSLIGETGDARDSIVIVGMTEESIPMMAEFAKQQSLPGVTGDYLSWRPVHGKFMEKLVNAKPRALVWDVYFEAHQPQSDHFLVVGINRLESAGVPVILGSSDYHDDGTPKLSPFLLEKLGKKIRHGAITARDMVANPGEIVMAIRRQDRITVPGLSITIFASLLHPEAQLDVDWAHYYDYWINLLYRLNNGGYLRDRDRIDLTRSLRASEDRMAIRSGDFIACNTFPLAPSENWIQRTFPYGKILGMGDEELQNAVEGKVILVGDLRQPKPGDPADRITVKYGARQENVPGSFVMADAIAGLLDRQFFKHLFPPPLKILLLMLLFALLGCFSPMRLAATSIFDWQKRRRIIGLVTGILLITAWGVTVVSDTEIVVYAGIAWMSLGPPFVGALWVELTRNRLRSLDADHRGFESLDQAMAGTLTLASKREKSRPAAE